MEYTNLHYGSDHDLFQQAPPPTQQQGMKLCLILAIFVTGLTG
jgi:hypothetical protein